jgi:hypothetical protein
MAAKNRTGSESASSQFTHAAVRGGRVENQSSRRVVLPAPAVPTTSVRRRCSPRSRRWNSLGRWTRWEMAFGGENLDEGNRPRRAHCARASAGCSAQSCVLLRGQPRRVAANANWWSTAGGVQARIVQSTILRLMLAQ